MAFDARALQIMIASPGDVQEERILFRDVVAQWNAMHAAANKVILLPVAYELDVPSELGRHPQELINSRILHDTDILVAVFWTRIGTPTKKAKGGAVEEVLYHLKRKRPVLAYFSDRPTSPSSVNSQQYSDLSEFKRWASRKGLYTQYEDTRNFAESLLRDIQQTINRNMYLRTVLPKEAGGAVGPLVIDLKPFSKDLLLKLDGSPEGKIFIKRQGGNEFALELDGESSFASSSLSDYKKWVDEIVSLIGRGILEDWTGRGEVFSITDEGRRLAHLLR